jgi:hypothetical protein
MMAMRYNAAIGITGALAAAALSLWYVAPQGSDFIDLRELTIEDSSTGEDPRILYHRDIHRDFDGTWIVTISRHRDNYDTKGYVACTGNGAASYKMDRDLPPSATNLSWLMQREDRPCRFDPGTYRAELSIVTQTLFGPMHTGITSNYFIVKPPNED